MEIRTTKYLSMRNGKQVTKTIRAHSEEELEEKFKKAKKEFNMSSDLANLEKLGDWADEWLKYKRQSGISDGTMDQYTSAVSHLKRYFGNEKITKIKNKAVQNMIFELAQNNPNTNKPTSKSTLYSIKKTLKMILKFAKKNEKEGIDLIVADVDIPKDSPVKKRNALSYEEQLMIINTPHRAQLPAMIVLFSGIRRSALFALKWEDVNLEKSYIIVHSFAVFNKETHKMKVKDIGKTEAAERYVEIPPILVDFLKDYKKSNTITSEYVFPNTSGGIHTPSSFRSLWDSYMLDLNVKYGYDGKISKYNPEIIPMRIRRFTSHYLRHTFATMLYLEGIDIETAKRMMGHESYRLTSDIYVDAQKNHITICDEYKKRLQTDFKIDVHS